MEYDESTSGDELIEVRLPLKDYKVMREMINERQAMSGFQKWLSAKVLFYVGSILTILGLIEALKRLS